MALPKTVEGEKFRLNISDGTAGAGRFKYFCLATTKSFKDTTEFEDQTKFDCDDPDKAAVLSSTPRLTKAEFTMSGGLALVKAKQLRDAQRAKTRLECQVIWDETAVNGGETEEFWAYVEEFERTSQNAGAVNFTAKLRIDGAITVTAVV